MRHLFLINPAAGKRDHTREFQAQIATAWSMKCKSPKSREISPGWPVRLPSLGDLFASMPAVEMGPSMRW